MCIKRFYAFRVEGIVMARGWVLRFEIDVDCQRADVVEWVLFVEDGDGSGFLGENCARSLFCLRH